MRGLLSGRIIIMTFHKSAQTIPFHAIGPGVPRRRSGRFAIAIAAGFGLALGASSASAMVTTFSVFTPEDTAPNVALKGLSLTADSLVRFRFTDPALASLGLVSAQWTFNAQEKSATPYGPYGLATFDGTFSYAYVGPTLVTAGGHTITAGDNLLTGTFLNGIFSGSGSAASLNASSMGSKNVVLSSSLLHFNPAAEEGIAFSFTSIVPPTEVVPPGQLADFTAVSSGNFAALPGAVPEPAMWSLMLIGMGGLGAALRRRRDTSAATAGRGPGSCIAQS